MAGLVAMASMDTVAPFRTVSALRTQAQVARVSIRDRSIAGWKAKSKFSSVWPSGRALSEAALAVALGRRTEPKKHLHGRPARRPSAPEA
jgi:hypothetical protein